MGNEQKRAPQKHKTGKYINYHKIMQRSHAEQELGIVTSAQNMLIIDIIRAVLYLDNELINGNIKKLLLGTNSKQKQITNTDHPLMKELLMYFGSPEEEIAEFSFQSERHSVAESERNKIGYPHPIKSAIFSKKAPKQGYFKSKQCDCV